MMKYRLYLLLFFCLVTGLQSRAQEKVITLSGKVTDVKTGQPVPFASIHLRSGSSGTVTNTAGEFIFKIAETHLQDTLLVSCIGYKTERRAVVRLVSPVTVALEPAAIVVQEIVLSNQSGLTLLKKALAKIPANYDTSATRLTAFYRENIRLGDFEMTYNEAVLDIYKIFRMDKKLNDQLRIIKGRKKNIDFGREAQFYYWINGISNGARGSLGDDMIKYHAAPNTPFNPDNYRYYDYNYTESIREGDRNLAVIQVVPKKDSKKALLRMKVFIDEASLAIIRYDYELTDAGVRSVSKKDKGLAYTVMSKVIGASLDYHLFKGSVSFKEYANKWYLNRVTRHWEILVNSEKRDMVNRPWVTDMDLVITDLQTKDVQPLTTGNIGNNEAPLGKMIDGKYDDAFWENYNILKPVSADSILAQPETIEKKDSIKVTKPPVSNRRNGFTRRDTLRGTLSSLRTCYDVTFYHLDVKVDLDKRSVKGSNLVRFKVQQPFRRMQVDLYENMKIDTILYKGRPLSYTREYDAVWIDFPEELKQGALQEIKICYQGVPKVPDRSIPMDGGVLWDTDSLGNPWAQVVCQGSGASLWWPNKDHQSDEPDSMRIWITVPAQFTEISNGRLVRKTPLPNDQLRYEWLVSYPINNYNVTFSIGKYVHYTGRYLPDDSLTIDYYVMPYNLERSKRLFAQVPEMLTVFEKNFGKYPFPRDGFTLLESLYPMEHQSGVCIGKLTAANTGDTNPLLWHESAHEWWGNAITSKDIADMWIHEAFASYAEVMVVEHRFGKEAADRAILDEAGKVRNDEPVTGVYNVNHIHYEIGDMYSKGSLMLHTFRNVLNNDEQWVSLLRNIQSRFRYQTVSAAELVAFINLQTKTDYTYFFDQYLKYTRIPKLELQLQQKGRDLSVKYRWQADVPDFRMPVRVTTALNRFQFINPGTAWKTMLLKNMQAASFETDEDHFFIEVDTND